MKQLQAVTLVLFTGWLGLVPVANGDVTFDCMTQLPPGKSEADAQTDNMPSVRLRIGDSKMGALQYTPGLPFPAKIHYSGGSGKIKAIFITAQEPLISQLVGLWAVQSGSAHTYACGSNVYAAVIGENLGDSGDISATVTLSSALSGWIEIKATIVGESGEFWTFTSALVGSTTQNTRK